MAANLSDAKKINLMETVWARCAETRLLMHYSILFKFEEDFTAAAKPGDKDSVLRRQQKLRESLQEDCFDHHSSNGWLRLDLLTRVRELSATCTATRILADSTIFPTVQSILSHSLYLKRVVPPSVSKEFDVGSAHNGDMLIGASEVTAKKEEEDIKIESERRLSGNPKRSTRTSSRHEFSSSTVKSSSISAAEHLLEKLYSKHSHTKCIEQLHLATGEVLRIYPSGKDAAQFMNVTQSGISLCTSGLRTDCYGFRWRIYEGPPIDCKPFLRLCAIPE
jgi:hypothetical protein